MKKEKYVFVFAVCIAVAVAVLVSCNEKKAAQQDETTATTTETTPAHQPNTVEITRSGLEPDSAAGIDKTTQWSVTVVVTSLSNASVDTVETQLKKMNGQQCVYDSTLKTNSSGVAYYHENNASPCSLYKARARFNGTTQTTDDVHAGDIVHYYFQ